MKRSARYLLQDPWFESWPGILGTSFTELEQGGKRRSSLYSGGCAIRLRFRSKTREFKGKLFWLVAKRRLLAFFRIKGKQKKANKKCEVQIRQKNLVGKMWCEMKRFYSFGVKNLFLTFKNEKCEAKCCKNTHLEEKTKNVMRNKVIFCLLKCFFVFLWSKNNLSWSETINLMQIKQKEAKKGVSFFPWALEKEAKWIPYCYLWFETKIFYAKPAHSNSSSLPARSDTIMQKELKIYNKHLCLVFYVLFILCSR